MFTPIIDVDTGNKSESEQKKELIEIDDRGSLLVVLGSIDNQLRLLNARFEEAFETQIEEADI